MSALLAAEWTKIRTLRSTVWTLLLTFLLSVGLGSLIGFSLRSGFDRMDAAARRNFDPVGAGFLGLTIGQIALVVFGVLLISAEYGSGTIRASLTAIPRRSMFYAAKALAALLIALPFSLVTVFASFFAAQAALGPHGTSLGDPGVLRATLGACVYLTLMCVFAMGVATILRSTAVSLGIMIPILFLDSQGLGNVPKIRTVAQFLPDQAGTVMMQATHPEASFVSHHDFGPQTALAILLTWTTTALTAGYLLLNHRDA